MILSRPFAAILLALAFAAPAQAQEKPLSRADVEKIVREYLIAHPEVIMESVEGMQRKQESAEQAKATKAIGEKQAELRDDGFSPVAGNPKGDITLVEFFDYNCGYCKKMLPVINALIEKDKNLRVVFKELPVLSAASETAARWGLAVNALDPSKYLGFHSALMSHQGAITEELLSAAATKLGLDPKAVKEKAKSKEIAERIVKIHALAQSLGIRGTPAFVVGQELIPGAVSTDVLEQRIKAARAKK